MKFCCKTNKTNKNKTNKNNTNKTKQTNSKQTAKHLFSSKKEMQISIV